MLGRRYLFFFGYNHFRICPKCGKGYNVADIHHGMPLNGERNNWLGDIILPPLLPKNENKCDNCNINLITRSDDKEEIIKKRMKIYHELTQPILNYYDNKSICSQFVDFISISTNRYII